MSEPVKGSFVGRFALKFVEVLGAGIATAVGSYLVAQLSGYWSSPVHPTAHQPVAVQVAPSAPGAAANPAANASVVSKAPRVDSDSSKAAAPDAPAVATAPPLRSTVTGNPGASRKRNAAEANAEAKSPEAKTPDAKTPEAKTSETKPAEKEARPVEKETAESKARDKEDKDSMEAQVRAALSNVDASRQPPSAPPGPPPNTSSVAAVPRGAEVAPPAQPLPPQAAPLSPVEIKSHPIADVDAAAAVDPEAKAQASQSGDKGLFAAFKKIPEFFRIDPHPAEDPPRPPAPVGEQ